MKNKLQKTIEEHQSAIEKLKKKIKEQEAKENALIGAFFRDYALNNHEFAQAVLSAINKAPPKTKKGLAGFADLLQKNEPKLSQQHQQQQ